MFHACSLSARVSGRAALVARSVAGSARNARNARSVQSIQWDQASKTSCPMQQSFSSLLVSRVSAPKPSGRCKRPISGGEYLIPIVRQDLGDALSRIPWHGRDQIIGYRKVATAPLAVQRHPRLYHLHQRGQRGDSAYHHRCVPGRLVSVTNLRLRASTSQTYFDKNSPSRHCHNHYPR